MANSKVPESLAIAEQREQFEQLQEKRGFDFPPDDVSVKAVQPSDGDKGGSSQELSGIFSPPPSYFEPPSLSPSVHQEQKRMPTSVSAYGSDVPTGAYMDLPLKKLRYESRWRLGLHLDPEYATASNWKVVADRLEFDNLEIRHIDAQANKTLKMLELYEIRNPAATVGDLYAILTDIDRHDVMSELEQYLERDYKQYTTKKSFDSSPGLVTESTYSFHSVSTSLQDSQVSTTLDKMPVHENYDAFVLYDHSDRDFILKEFLPKIEDGGNIRLFLPDRDMTGGVQAYHAQLEAMISRCKKLVVILSNEFLTSVQSQWALNVGVSLDPASRYRKIIPVIYKTISEPNILAGYNAVDRTRVLEDAWFWNNLIRSLRS